MTTPQARAYFVELGYHLLPTDRVEFNKAEQRWELWRKGPTGSERIAKFEVAR